MKVSIFKTLSERSKIALGPFVLFQSVALISLPVWFFFWMLMNVGKSVTERNVSIVIYFLFGPQWQLPSFLFLVSVSMWFAVALRLKRTAFLMGVSLCLPLLACGVISFLEYYRYIKIS